MSLSTQIAKHLRDVHFGGNWCAVDLKATLADVTWQQATTNVHSLNSIYTLVFHNGYYLKLILRVMEGGPLEGNDKLSFQHPPLQSQEEWEALQAEIWANAERLAVLVEQLSDDQLLTHFSDGKYGNVSRTIGGFIEHTHYHLGQMRLIKKLVADLEIH
ncbi:MAG: DinB family protein [Saprospiraceae bacterium]|nr:DinB family protein [Saprospiraceae bacterium]